MGTITNSDLEMAGMLLHFLVLEHVVALRHVHVAAWCDSTPTVSWTNKLSSSRSSLAGRLTHALALRIHANKASPLVLKSGLQHCMQCGLGVIWYLAALGHMGTTLERQFL
jgi:hypothetical protein